MTTKTINFEGPFSCGPSLQQACNAVSIVLVEARWHGEDVQTWSVDVRGKHSDIIRLKELLRGGHRAIVEAEASKLDRQMNGYLPPRAADYAGRPLDPDNAV